MRGSHHFDSVDGKPTSPMYEQFRRPRAIHVLFPYWDSASNHKVGHGNRSRWHEKYEQMSTARYDDPRARFGRCVFNDSGFRAPRYFRLLDIIIDFIKAASLFIEYRSFQFNGYSLCNFESEFSIEGHGIEGTLQVSRNIILHASVKTPTCQRRGCTAPFVTRIRSNEGEAWVKMSYAQLDDVH